jgi:hypothetical protein
MTMKTLLRRLLVVAAGVLALAAPALCDTLELKDGRVIQGKYLGGTQQNIRFLVDNEVKLFPVSEAVAITFTGGALAAETSAPGAPAPEKAVAAAPAAEPARHPSGGTADQKVTVPAGTRIVVRMIDSVDSDKSKVGERFRASLDEDLLVGDVVVAPKNSDVNGRLAEAKQAGHLTGKSELKLELTDVVIGGQRQPIVTGDYDVSGKSRGVNTAEKVGAGAAIGAVIGAIVGGGKGAAIGAGTGAGAGTAIQIFTRGEQVHVPSETRLEFTIEQPFTVRPAKSASR